MNNITALIGTAKCYTQKLLAKLWLPAIVTAIAAI